MHDVLLKKKFKLALEACTEKYIGIKNHDRLFRLLKNQKDYSMSEIRKILQSTFNALQEKNIIPSREMGISNEAEKSRFFAGKKAFSSRIDDRTGQSKEMIMGKNYQFKKKYMTPKPIATIETHLWSLTSDWSHDQNADSDNPDLVMKTGETSFIT